MPCSVPGCLIFSVFWQVQRYPQRRMWGRPPPPSPPMRTGSQRPARWSCCVPLPCSIAAALELVSYHSYFIRRDDNEELCMNIRLCHCKMGWQTSDEGWIYRLASSHSSIPFDLNTSQSINVLCCVCVVCVFIALPSMPCPVPGCLIFSVFWQVQRYPQRQMWGRPPPPSPPMRTGSQRPARWSRCLPLICSIAAALESVSNLSDFVRTDDNKELCMISR